MVVETMTREERIKAAIRLEPTDRTPVALLLNLAYASQYAGLTIGECIRDEDKGRQVTLDAFDELGGFDGMILPGFSYVFPPKLSAILATPLYKVPGRDLPDNSLPQYDEREVLSLEDYDRIIDLGWKGFAEKYYHRFSSGGPEKILAWGARQTEKYLKDIETWKERGVPCLCGAFVLSPLMFFSLMRTLTKFTFDLYRRPDQVAAAMDAVVDDFIDNGIEMTKITGIPGAMLVLERGGGFYYPLKIFERFEFPYIKKMVETWAAEGIITTLHFDQDWTINLPYLKDLPERQCICELDSCTDIFKAKEILRGHMCIMGDVPASLQTLGTPQEMETYCKKLINGIGEGGGFILSTGCQVAVDAKFINLKTMIDTAKHYLPTPGKGMNHRKKGGSNS